MAQRKKTAATLGLYVREEHANGYYHVRASVVWIGLTPSEMQDIDNGRTVESVPNDRIRNISNYDSEYTPGLSLGNLSVYSQGNEDNTPRRLYAWSVVYQSGYTVERREAESMAKTLGTVERRMEKMNEEYGRAGSFGTYLMRVAKAIGASRIVLAKGTRGWSYDEGAHRIMELRDGAATVDSLIYAWTTADGREAPIAVNGE